MSRYTDAVTRNLDGIEAVSTGLCPGCQECADNFGYASLDDFRDAYESGKVYDEGGFSHSGCDICGSPLGGDFECWHGILDGKLFHGDCACVDCVMYLANGDEPENWEG